MAPLIYLAVAGFLMTLPAVESHVVSGGEELVKLQKRGAPQQPSGIVKPAEPKKEHAKVHTPGNGRQEPPGGKVVVLLPRQPEHPQRPQHPSKPVQHPGAGNPQTRPWDPQKHASLPGVDNSVRHPQQPSNAGWQPGAGNPKSHPPAAGEQKPSGLDRNAGGKGCSCHEKSCPSHPCRRGGSSVKVKQVVKTGQQQKPKSTGSNSCPCWDRSCPSHPCRNAMRPVAEPGWD